MVFLKYITVISVSLAASSVGVLSTIIAAPVAIDLQAGAIAWGGGGGWSGGAMVLGKLSVPGRPTYLDYSRARAYCTCSRCGWGLFGHFYSRLSFLSSFSLSLGDGPI